MAHIQTKLNSLSNAGKPILEVNKHVHPIQENMFRIHMEEILYCETGE